jgi:hypothetical protein
VGGQVAHVPSVAQRRGIGGNLTERRHQGGPLALRDGHDCFFSNVRTRLLFPERIRRQTSQKLSTPSTLITMPWPVRSLVKRVPFWSASMVQPTAE